MCATPYISAVLCFAVARFETAVETAVASRYIRLCYISAKLCLHPIVFPLRSLRGRCRLRQMRCNSNCGVSRLIIAVGRALLVFLEAILHSTNTFFAVSRPGAADETTANGTDKSVPYKGAVQKLSNALTLRETRTVSSVASIPGHQR